MRLEWLEPRCLLASLSGRVFEDVNGNQTWDAAGTAPEPTCACWEVYLDLNRDGSRQDGEPLARTDSQGWYRFENLAPGEYAVELVGEPGYVRTTPVRFAESTSLIPAAPRDQVFDPIRNVLYVTSGDRILRRDPTTGATLASLALGTSLTGIDMTPDGRYLVVGEGAVDAVEGIGYVFVIDLTKNDAVTTIPFATSSTAERGVFDLVAVSNTRVLFTTNSLTDAPVPLREVDLATGAVSPRNDAFRHGAGLLRPGSRLDRGEARTAAVVLEPNEASGPLYLYDSQSNSFPRSTLLGAAADQAHVAVNRDGTLIAVETPTLGLRILNSQLSLVQTLLHFRGGVAFDPQRDILYAGDTGADELVALSTRNWEQLYRTAVGEDLPSAGQYFEMQVNRRAQFLSVSTPGGVRLVRLDRPAPHVVSAAADTVLANLDFGNISNGQNRRPRAVNDSYVVQEDTPLQVPAAGVVSNDEDPDGNPVKAVLADPPQHGSLELLPSGAFLYTPRKDFFGTDAFTYTLQDQSLSSACRATVTLQVAAVNDPPTQIDVSGNKVRENSSGAAIGNVSVIDVDPGDQHVWTVSDSRFEVVDGVLRLRSLESLDHEAAAEIPIVLTATDSGSPARSLSRQLTIVVEDVNEFDPVIRTTSLEVGEGSGTVGRVQATDGDSSQTLRLAITGGNNQGIFAIDPQTGVITIQPGKTLDYEGTAAYILAITASDNVQPERSTTQNIVITVTDVNESAPQVTPAAFTVAENSSPGTLVGRVTAVDLDTSQSLHFALTGGNAGGAFAIDAATGQITVADMAALDVETTPQFTLVVTVTDSGSPPQSGTAPMTIQLTDVNEHSPEASNQQFAVPENSPADWLVGTIAATDLDRLQHLLYAIVAGNDQGVFVLDSASGELRVSNSAMLDREQHEGFELTVTIVDSGSPSRETTITVTVRVDDRNEFPPQLDDISVSLPENSIEAALVVALVAKDEDATRNHRYTVVGGSGAAFFTATADGRIQVAPEAVLDFESVGSLELIVEVREDGLAQASDTATVRVKLLDVNEFPPVTVDQTVTLDENAAPGSLAGQVMAIDGDSAQSVSYQITGGNASQAFAIDPNTGAITVVKSELLDFETARQFVLTVTATDSGTPPQSTVAAVTIVLQDRNEAAPKVDDQTFQVFENAPVGTVVGDILAFDIDVFQGLTFAILSGNSGNAFALDAVTGRLTVASHVLDFETRARFQLTVQVTDNGVPPLSDTAVVTIDVLDLNEFPIDISLGSNTVQAGVAGALIGQVSVQDPDRNDQHVLEVDDSRFEINNRRELKLKSGVAVQVAEEPQITIQITATDLGGESHTEPFVIVVTGNLAAWQNPRDPRDVNNDGVITPQDALVIINEINNPQHSEPNGRLFVPRPDIPGLPFYDVNGDGFVTAIDVLIIINRLNQSSAESSGGEGESSDAGEAEPQPVDTVALARTLPVGSLPREDAPPPQQPSPFPFSMDEDHDSGLRHELAQSTPQWTSLLPVSGGEGRLEGAWHSVERHDEGHLVPCGMPFVFDAYELGPALAPDPRDRERLVDTEYELSDLEALLAEMFDDRMLAHFPG